MIRDVEATRDDARVVSNHEFEMIAAKGKIVRPSDGKPAKNVVFIQSPGKEEDDADFDYCGSVTSLVSLKQARYVTEDYSDGKAYVIYQHMRTPGLQEYFYKSMQQQDGVFFIDRNGRLFEYVAEYLRDDGLRAELSALELERLYEEADYYALDGLLTDEEILARDTVRRFVDKQFRPHLADCREGRQRFGLPPEPLGIVGVRRTTSATRSRAASMSAAVTVASLTAGG